VLSESKLVSAHAVQMCLYEVLLYADGEEAVMYAEAAHVVAALLEDVLDKLDGVHLHRVMGEADPRGTLEPMD
jgi:DNA-binding response OmpR family regulator